MIKEIVLPADLKLPPAQILKAGAITCLYETGNLRYIGIGKTELVRKIYGAVRNHNWTTIPYTIQDETITTTEDGFIIKYTAFYTQETNLYKAEYLIEGKADNTISFSMKGTALSGFKKNRIGLCVHHPLKECKGRNASVTRPDRSEYQSFFPDLVSPSLPFLEISQLVWIAENGPTVRLDFEGDVFETEDQRNWSDGSYKTYSTRSATSRPVEVKAADTIEQKITLTISGSEHIHQKESPGGSREVPIPFPQIGYCRPANDGFPDAAIVERMIKIPFDHYRVTVVMGQHLWRRQLQQALAEASRINTKLELVVFFSEDYRNEVTPLVGQLSEKQLLVRSILLLQKHRNVTPPELLQYLYPLIKTGLPAVRIGYGTDEWFVDVNQHRPADLPFDFVSFGLFPQAHAFDNRSILENLQSQPFMMKTAVSISGGKPVCISPVTLNDRSSAEDERQHSYLVALYMLITLQNFSEAYSITFFDLFGAGGILFTAQQENGLPGTIKPSPLYQVLAAIFDFRPVWVIKRFTGDELLTDGLLLENEKGDRLFFKAPAEYSLAVKV